MRDVIAEVSPNRMPKIAATRSKCAMPTRPQLRAPTMTRTDETAFKVFMCGLLLQYLFVNVMQKNVNGSKIKRSVRSQVSVEKKNTGVLTHGQARDWACSPTHSRKGCSSTASARNCGS